MQSATFFVEVDGARTTALSYGSPDARTTLVLAHGAGAPQTHPWIVDMAQAIALRGIHVVTFNFLYAEAGRRAPDRNGVLETTWRAVIHAVRERAAGDRRLFVGGKSMGGRIATQVIARDDLGVAGVVLLGYPLHPPGRPEQLRSAHLSSVRAPMLFVQGSRDNFGTPEELRPILDAIPTAQLLVVEGGDHSLSVRSARKQGGAPTRAATTDRVADAIAAFMKS